MDAVKEEYRDSVCTITLNRPGKKNAMDSELLPALFTRRFRAFEG